MKPTEKQVRAALKALDRAIDALGPLVMTDRETSGARRLRADLREYAEYLAAAGWWRAGAEGGNGR